MLILITYGPCFWNWGSWNQRFDEYREAEVMHSRMAYSPMGGTMDASCGASLEVIFGNLPKKNLHS